MSIDNCCMLNYLAFSRSITKKDTIVMKNKWLEWTENTPMYYFRGIFQETPRKTWPGRMYTWDIFQKLMEEDNAERTVCGDKELASEETEHGHEVR